MRIPTLVIPVALVAGYAALHAVRADRDTNVPTPAAGLHAVAAPLVDVEPGSAPAAIAARHAATAARPAPFARAHGADETVYVHAEITASLVASLDGILDLVNHELEANAEQSAEAHRLIELSTSIAGKVAAELDGYLEIETNDGERIQVSTSSGNHSR